MFEVWTEPVISAAQVKPGDYVLDIACGTGVLARAAWERVGESGTVLGLDVNEGMLDVAKAKLPNVEWI